MNLGFKSFAQMEKSAEVIQYLQSLAETKSLLRKNAVIYIRKSRMILKKNGHADENDADEIIHSPKFPEQACRQLAERQGWNVLCVFKDLNKSGKKLQAGRIPEYDDSGPHRSGGLCGGVQH
jgi:hypothetical protein